jgi:hypothetical protein
MIEPAPVVFVVDDNVSFLTAVSRRAPRRSGARALRLCRPSETRTTCPCFASGTASTARGPLSAEKAKADWQRMASRWRA